MSQNIYTRLLPTSGFIGIFVSVLVIFFIIPLFVDSFSPHLLLQAAFVAIVCSTIYSIHGMHSIKYVSAGLVIPFIVLDALSIHNDSLYLMAYSYIFYALFLFYAIYLIALKIFFSTEVTTDVIFGVITIYLFAGILFSKLYYLCDLFYPHSFSGIKSVDIYKDTLTQGFSNQFDLLYYSFTTLTGLGLGDIVSLRHIVKSLTILEAMFGQLFIATVIAKFVGTWNHFNIKQRNASE